MSRKDYEYTRQRVIKEYDYKFDCQREACSLYPCYAQWFCDGLSDEGRVLLEARGAKIVRMIEKIRSKSGSKHITWVEVWSELNKQKYTAKDILLKNAKGEVLALKRSLIEIEDANGGLSPQKIGQGVNRLFWNIWLASTDKLTIARNLNAFQAQFKKTPGVILGEGARRHVSKIVFEEEGNYPQS